MAQESLLHPAEPFLACFTSIGFFLGIYVVELAWSVPAMLDWVSVRERTCRARWSIREYDWEHVPHWNRPPCERLPCGGNEAIALQGRWVEEQCYPPM